MAESGERRGPIAWMANNTVAANLLMLFIIVGGLLNLKTTKQEVFPEFEVDLVTIGVAYPGASPSEVEQGMELNSPGKYDSPSLVDNPSARHTSPGKL